LRTMMRAEDLFMDGSKDQIKSDGKEQPRVREKVSPERQVGKQQARGDDHEFGVANADVEAIFGSGESLVVGKPFGVFGVRIGHAASFTVRWAEK
jgi:hypothetical protein